jgi:rhodanese-related sulfurtransferase
MECRQRNGAALTGSSDALARLPVIYTNIDNLAGGMTAWTAGGRQIVQLNRQ